MTGSGQGGCPIPDDVSGQYVTLAHGEGGRLMRQLIRQRIAPVLLPDRELGDAAVVGEVGGRVVLTADSFVVSPLFFPGGDIGSLCVHGVVNDLAVSGARPQWLTTSWILEEGLPLATLDRVLASLADAARRCGVAVVAGDTKVVPRGAADQMFISVSAIGTLLDGAPPGPQSIHPGDRLIVSGPIGNHGIAVLAERERLDFDPAIESDSAPLHRVTAALQAELGGGLRAMRDATRGGVSAVLHEWAEASKTTMSLDEQCIPVTQGVRGACELLGLDPLYVANEGTFVVAVSDGMQSRAIEVMRLHEPSRQACVIGQVSKAGIVPVTARGLLGVQRPVDEPSGAPLPRIC